MSNSPISRVAQRLRNISQLSLQIARVETEDAKLVGAWPDQLRALAEMLIDAGETLNRHAGEVEVYWARHQEDVEGLQTLAQTAANIATIFGTDGGNLKILTHSDPNYIVTILTDAEEGAMKEAVARIPKEQRDALVAMLEASH